MTGAHYQQKSLQAFSPWVKLDYRYAAEELIHHEASSTMKTAQAFVAWSNIMIFMFSLQQQSTDLTRITSEQETSYTALSYEWGSEDSCHKIFIMPLT
jgi:hypothetical protein